MKLQLCGFGLAMMFLVVSPVSAQNDPSLDAGRKIRDGGVAHGVQMYQRHVQDRSQVLHYYSQSKQPIPKVRYLVSGMAVCGMRSVLTPKTSGRGCGS